MIVHCGGSNPYAYFLVLLLLGGVVYLAENIHRLEYGLAHVQADISIVL